LLGDPVKKSCVSVCGVRLVVRDRVDVHISVAYLTLNDVEAVRPRSASEIWGINNAILE